MSTAPDTDAPPEDDSREFERYALVAALTLLVLCLLWIDRRDEMTQEAAALDADSLLVVELGGPPPTGTAQITRPSLREGDGDGLDARPPVEPASSTEPARVTPEPPAAVQPAAVEPRVAEPPPAVRQRVYVVEDGDTLSGIASRELGSSRRAKDIQDLNDISDPRKIHAGDILLIPVE